MAQSSGLQAALPHDVRRTQKGVLHECADRHALAHSKASLLHLQCKTNPGFISLKHLFFPVAIPRLDHDSHFRTLSGACVVMHLLLQSF